MNAKKRKRHLTTDVALELIFLPDGELSDIDSESDGDCSEDHNMKNDHEKTDIGQANELEFEFFRNRDLTTADSSTNPLKINSTGSISKAGSKEKNCKRKEKNRRIWTGVDENEDKEDATFHGHLPDPPDDVYTPYEYFCQIFDREILKIIVRQSNLYSMQKKGGSSSNITMEEMRKFIAILLLSGIVKMPSFRMFWQIETRYPLIADLMSRNRFEEICSALHFNDNTNQKTRSDPSYDRLFKIKPIIEKFRNNLKVIAPEEHQSIDEQIIPFKGRNFMKQYNKAKPHKWGFQVFTRTSSSGIMHDFKIYEGKGTSKDHGLGISGNIILDLIDGLLPEKRFKVYFDNWFSSLKLIQELQRRGIMSVSTIRNDRLENCPLRKEKEVELFERGAANIVRDADSRIKVVSWKDNKVLTLASNYAGVFPKDTCKRWNAKEKKFCDIDRPYIVQEYNKYMGGVDLADMLIELYRIDHKSKKWYMRIFYWVLDASVVNSWLLYKRHSSQLYKNKKDIIPLLNFRSYICKALSASKRNKCSDRSPSIMNSPTAIIKNPVALRPISEVRYDGLNHWLKHD